MPLGQILKGATQGIGLITGAITSGIVARRAKKEADAARADIAKAEAERVDYQTPDAINDMVKQNSVNALGKSSLQTAMEEKARKKGSDYIRVARRASGSGSDLLLNAQAGVEATNDAMNDAVIAGEQDQIRKQQELNASRQIKAQYEDQEWELNQNREFLRKYERGMENLAAAKMTRHNALMSVGKTAAAAGHYGSSLMGNFS